MRPPTPGSHRTSTTRLASDQKLMGPRTHQRSISAVKMTWSPARLSGGSTTLLPVPFGELEARIGEADGIVQATPIGMTKLPGMPIDPRLLRPEMWLAEIVYVPIETELLRAARALGCATVDGGGMVVLQAARAFEIFTGLTPDTDRMQRHLLDLLGEKAN